jgi:hypothetical protein
MSMRIPSRTYPRNESSHGRPSRAIRVRPQRAMLPPKPPRAPAPERAQPPERPRPAEPPPEVRTGRYKNVKA